MPAGDGATREVAEPTCQWCGADLAGPFRVRVDEWCAFACQTCAEGNTPPAECVVYALPRTDGEA